MADKKKDKLKELGFQPIKHADLEKYGFQPIQEKPKTTGEAIQQKVESIVPSVEAVQETGSNVVRGAKDFGLGAVQGATMGGADELGGGMDVLFDLIQRGANKVGLAGKSPSQVNAELKAQGIIGDVGPADLSEVYRQGQIDTEQMFKEAEERNPNLYLAGEVGGAIGSGLLTGGAATAGLAKAGIQTGGKIALKEAAKQGTKALSKEIGKRALLTGGVAGLEGAAMGALGSEEGKLIGATPEEREKLLADTAGGTITGNLLGAGASIASDVLPKVGGKVTNAVKKKLDDYIADSPLIRQFLKAKEFGEKGIDLYSEKEMLGKGVGPALSQMEQKSSSELVEKIMNADQKLGKAVGQSLEEATLKGVMIDVTDEASQVAQGLQKFFLDNSDLLRDKPGIKAIQKMFPGKGVLTPVEGKAAINAIDEVIDGLDRDPNINSRMIQEQALKLRQIINAELGNAIPAYKQAAQRMTEFRRLVPETIISGKTPIDLSGVRYGDLRNKEAKLYDQARQMIEGTTKAGTATGKSKEVFTNLQDSLAQLEKAEGQRIASGQLQPGEDVFSAMGGTPESLLGGIKEAADESAMKQIALGVNPQQGVGTTVKSAVGAVANTGRGAMMWAGNKLGRIEEPLKKIVKAPASKPAELGRKLYSLTNDQYIQVARELGMDPKTSKLGQALEQAIANNDIPKRNAVLFALLQQPKVREMFLSGKDVGE